MRLTIISALAKLLGVSIYVNGVRWGAREAHGLTD